MHESKAFKLTKAQRRLKKNDQLLNLMFSFFHFPHSNVLDSNYHKQKWRVLFFTRTQNIGPCAGVCPCNRMDQIDKTAHSLIKFNFLGKTQKNPKYQFTQ